LLSFALTLGRDLQEREERCADRVAERPLELVERLGDHRVGYVLGHQEQPCSRFWTGSVSLSRRAPGPDAAPMPMVRLSPAHRKEVIHNRQISVD
jgi:hypothetical protein